MAKCFASFQDNSKLFCYRKEPLDIVDVQVSIKGLTCRKFGEVDTSHSVVTR
jgi:hypothetical protein